MRAYKCIMEFVLDDIQDLQILVSLSESSYLPVSIDRVCDDVLSLKKQCKDYKIYERTQITGENIYPSF